MIYILSLLVFYAPAHALSAAEFNAYLAQPIDARIKMFRTAAVEGAEFLRTLAFDAKAPLQSRWRAVTTLGRWDSVHFRPELERALTSKDWFMRNAGLIALQSAPREMSVPWSMRLVVDPALVVRTQAVRNLIQLQARESEDLLWREIFSKRNFRGHESLWVRAHMAEALARFSSPGKAKAFKRLLLEPDARLHKWALLGLENTTGFKMTDPHEPVELRRQKWLARLGQDAI
jgi:HEAT repeat protein